VQDSLNHRHYDCLVMKINELKLELFATREDFLRAIRLPTNHENEIIESPEADEVLATMKEVSE